MSRKATNRLTGEEQDEVATVVVIPPTCPSCGSTKRTQLESYKRLESSGEIQGVIYSAVIWHYTSCCECGQRYRVKTFE